VQQLDVASDKCRGIVDACIIAVQILGQCSGAASDLQYLIFLLNIEAAADLSSHLFHINLSALVSVEGQKILYAALSPSLARPDLLPGFFFCGYDLPCLRLYDGVICL